MCQHDWKVLSETVTESKIEHSIKQLGGATKHIPAQLCCADRKHIQVFNCIHCGKLRRFVERI